ncbi:MAG: hypothetical protein CVU96_01900 [Firmicutes bacterium HGW-Firmicutes-20]|jgi:hypothetical protein|nr:MAG: hypothetical protein CVU96_01900 [Firmicutes bacterium HGW-Firmicutes-20]PKM68998.1 MAG: hypothetical protein CVU94_04730 [Firmicutes bacterium HGW-Firmicutes-19]
MASKIKIMIKTEDNNINLPSIGFGVALTFVRFGLWTTKFVKNMDEKNQRYLRENKETIIKMVKEIFAELKTMEPFTLVEVKSDDAYVLIDIR